MAEYVRLGGSPILLQPFAQNQSVMYGFVYKADIKKLINLCNQWFNDRPQNLVRYKPVCENILVTYTPIGKITSLNPADEDKGWTKETDVSFWILCYAQVPDGKGGWKDDRLVLFTPYIYVDNPFTIATGREVYGFPKNEGRFVVPDTDEEPDYFETTVNALKTYSPQTEALWQKLFSITNEKPGEKHLHIDIKDFLEVGKHIKEWITHPTCPDAQFFINMIMNLMKGETPMVFLKQFPEVSDGSKAAYQAIVEAPIQITKFTSLHILKGDFKMDIQDLASQPICADLGESLNGQSAMFAYKLEFDFNINNGTIIWKA